MGVTSGAPAVKVNEEVLVPKIDPAGEGDTSEGFEMKVWLVWLKREARLRPWVVSWEGDVANLALGAILKTYSWARPCIRDSTLLSFGTKSGFQGRWTNATIGEQATRKDRRRQLADRKSEKRSKEKERVNERCQGRELPANDAMRPTKSTNKAGC
jgi:hypothetical protein